MKSKNRSKIESNNLKKSRKKQEKKFWPVKVTLTKSLEEIIIITIITEKEANKINKIPDKEIEVEKDRQQTTILLTPILEILEETIKKN